MAEHCFTEFHYAECNYVECHYTECRVVCYLAVAPQSSAKTQIYIIIYYITLNSNCEAHRVYKNLKKMWKRGLEAKIN
jgi:hypothetical protein